MSEKPPITTVAGQVLSDEDQTPEARRLAGAVLNQAREDQADDAESEPSAPTESAIEASEEAASDPEHQPADEDSGLVGHSNSAGRDNEPSASDNVGQPSSVVGGEISIERRAELETERTNLQRIHSKSLNEPGFARRVMAIQGRLAEIDKELDE